MLSWLCFPASSSPASGSGSQSANQSSIFSSFRLWISICRSALPLLCFCKAFWVETELQFTAANGELWTSDLLTLLTKSCLTMPLEQRFQFPSGCCQISTTEFGLCWTASNIKQTPGGPCWWKLLLLVVGSSSSLLVEACV